MSPKAARKIVNEPYFKFHLVLFAIDEAHCITEFALSSIIDYHVLYRGKDFVSLPRWPESVNKKGPVLCITASA